tara:strand:- start:4855 stop:5463 length:609 start_codon:yes stop_codon:yes gene_type:complete
MYDKQNTNINIKTLIMSKLTECPNKGSIEIVTNETNNYRYTYKKYDVEITRITFGGNKKGDWAVDIYKPYGVRLRNECFRSKQDCIDYAQWQIENHLSRMESEQMAVQIDSIVWFGLNYPQNFIDECWSDDPCLANHLNDKFQSCTQVMLKRDGEKMNEYQVRKFAMSYGVFTRFLTMLDNGNREKLYDYILSVYNHRKGWL